MIPTQDLEKNIAEYKHKILGVKLPRDEQLLKQLETRIAQNPQNEELIEERDQCLLRASTTEFLQIRDIHNNTKTQKKELIVVRTCSSKVSNQVRDQVSAAEQSGQAGQIDATHGKDSVLDGLGLASGYLMISKFKLSKMVF